MRLVIWKKRRRIEPQAGTVCGSTRLAGADLPLMISMGEVGRQPTSQYDMIGRSCAELLQCHGERKEKRPSTPFTHLEAWSAS
jgi:hypothetical protein